MNPTEVLRRAQGAVIGAAIGDAMGHPTEFLSSLAEIRRTYPPNGVTGFELWWERDGLRFAPYTDDTQMAEIVLRCLVNGAGVGASLDEVMTAVAAGFVEWRDRPQGGHRAPGNACMSGAAALKRGVSWREAGGATAGGCGSVMRAYPFGIVFADDPGRAVEWAVQHSAITHRDPIALAACAAMAAAMTAAMRGKPIEECFALMAPTAASYSKPTGSMISEAIAAAQAGTPPEVTLLQLQGWAAHEAIAAAVYVVSRHPRDCRAAVLEAANAPGDSDSIATLVGALMGSAHGVTAWPEDWVLDVERSSDLLDLASAAAIVSQLG